MGHVLYRQRKQGQQVYTKVLLIAINHLDFLFDYSYTSLLNPYVRGSSNGASVKENTKEDYPPHIPVVKTKEQRDDSSVSLSLLYLILRFE